MRLLLASSSPRRNEILSLLKVPFEIVTPEFDERISEDVPVEKEVLEFALGKAQSVATQHPQAIVIGSDTMIQLDEEKIGKPADRRDAARILRALSGKTHVIFTSVAILDDCGGPGLREIEKVAVQMRRYTEEEIQAYLSSGESHDKAGAYSIQGQGSALIGSIRGDYLAAVGMPLRRIAGYLKNRGLSVADIDTIYSEKRFLNWTRFA